MELNIKFDEKMIVETANKVLDEFEYNGKTIREWSDMLANQKTNADHVRAMDSDKIIEWFCRGRPCGTCPYGGNVECSIRDWLKEEAQ